MRELDHGGAPVPDEHLPEFCRHTVERLRREADQVPIIEARNAILEVAEGFERLDAGHSFEVLEHVILAGV